MDKAREDVVCCPGWPWINTSLPIVFNIRSVHIMRLIEIIICHRGRCRSGWFAVSFPTWLFRFYTLGANWWPGLTLLRMLMIFILISQQLSFIGSGHSIDSWLMFWSHCIRLWNLARDVEHSQSYFDYNLVSTQALSPYPLFRSISSRYFGCIIVCQTALLSALIRHCLTWLSLPQRFKTTEFHVIMNCSLLLSQGVSSLTSGWPHNASKSHLIVIIVLRRFGLFPFWLVGLWHFRYIS